MAVNDSRELDRGRPNASFHVSISGPDSVDRDWVELATFEIDATSPVAAAVDAFVQFAECAPEVIEVEPVNNSAARAATRHLIFTSPDGARHIRVEELPLAD